MKTILYLPQCLALAAICATGCKTDNTVSERDLSARPAVEPSMVYVSDFELEAAEIKDNPSVLSQSPGPVGRIGDRLSGTSSNPTTRARQIVDLMANSIVEQLSTSGIAARRSTPGGPLPSNGWLVRGLFTEVDEGNRLRRAMIGFGQGRTDIQVIARVDDLARGLPQPLYEVDTGAVSGAKPGAAPTLVLGPYGAAARFVMSGHDLEKNVNQTAAKIAQTIAARIRSATGNVPDQKTTGPGL